MWGIHSSQPSSNTTFFPSSLVNIIAGISKTVLMLGSELVQLVPSEHHLYLYTAFDILGITSSITSKFLPYQCLSHREPSSVNQILYHNSIALLIDAFAIMLRFSKIQFLIHQIICKTLLL